MKRAVHLHSEMEAERLDELNRIAAPAERVVLVIFLVALTAWGAAVTGVIPGI